MLDWGQGLYDLEAFAREHDIDRLHIAYAGSAPLCEHDLPELVWLPPRECATGWVAVSELYFRGVLWTPADDPCAPIAPPTPCRAGSEDRPGYRWLDDVAPAARIGGGSIRVYHVPER